MGINFGVDYYPEHWSDDRLETDVKLMKELGINLVRMAEFSWTKMEPRKGEFDFAWLDRAVNLLGENGIKTMMGTPTATPPRWIVDEVPGLLPMDSQGRVMEFGGRHHDCQSNNEYREHIRRIVTAMAEHYKDNPHVDSWQIDNELGNSHEDLCHCASCRSSFQSWLEEKYETIEKLNGSWGTAFWSQTYDRFDQIPTPMYTATSHSPSLILDWKRFHSDLIVDFQNFQVEILKGICPESQKITHDMMGLHGLVDYYKLSEELDYVCHNQYPWGFFDNPQPGKSAHDLASTLDFVRSFKKGGQSFWITEQQSGITGWEILGRAPRPGQLALWVTQSVAHGADTIIFFRWRTCSIGTEQYWHGVLPHSGIPGRNYYELQECIRNLNPVMEECRGALPKAEVAILFDYDQHWAFQIQPHHPDLNYIKQLQKYYKGFFDRNIPVDFINSEDELKEYRIVLAPMQYIMNSAREAALKEWVKAGGQLLMTMRTGVKDLSNACMIDRSLPGALGDLLGIEIRDYDCLRDVSVEIDMDGSRFSCEKWSDVITPVGAETVASYGAEYYAGKAACTVNRFGDGKAWYVGCEPDDAMIASLTGKMLQGLGVKTLIDSAPEGLEFSSRTGSEGEYLFVMNHTGSEKKFDLPAGWKAQYGTEVLGPYGTACFKI